MPSHRDGSPVFLRLAISFVSIFPKSNVYFFCRKYRIYRDNTFNADDLQNYEIIYLNGRNEATTPILYELTAFGR